MPRELFLTVMEGTGLKSDPYRGKYVSDANVTQSGTLRYSRTSHAIVMIEAPQAYLDFVGAQPDATSLANASNIDQVLGPAQVNAAQTIFEDAFIPNLFINVGDTRRQVIRGVVGMFLFSQRMEGRFGEGWKERAVARGITLNSTWQEFPAALQNELIQIRDSFGWTNQQLGVNATSTLREILKAISTQFEATPIFIGGQQI